MDVERGRLAIGVVAVLILVVAATTAVARDAEPGVVVAGPSESPTPVSTASASPDGVGVASPGAASSSGGASTPAPSGTPATAAATAAPDTNDATTPAVEASTPPPASPAPQPTSEPAPEPTPTPTPSASPTPEPAGYQPVPAGTYRYDTDGTTRLNNQDPQRLPAVTTLEASGATDGRQELRRDLRHDDGEGSVTTLDLTLRGDGAYLHRVDIATTVNILGGFTDRRSFAGDGPVLLAAPGAQPGDVQTFTLTGDGTTLQGTVTILREETIQVGGTSVGAVVVEQVFDLSGDVEGRSTTTAWMRPSDLLTLREEVSTDATAMGQRSRSDYTAVLQSLP